MIILYVCIIKYKKKLIYTLIFIALIFLMIGNYF